MSNTMSLNALMIGCVIIAGGTAVANADEEKTSTSAAEKVLNEKGLTRDEKLFLLDETEALAKYEKAKTAYADYQKARKRYAEILQYDEAVQAMEMERQALQQEVTMLQSQINSAGSGSSRMRRYSSALQAPLRQQQANDQAMINQINSQIQASRAQAPKADDRKTVPAEYERTRHEFNESLHDLSEALTPLLTKYHELALDKAVIDALAQLRHSTTHNYKLGPSDQIAAASRLIHDGKKSAILKSKPASKKRAKTKGS
jgi:hypothetical protein